MQAHKCLGIPVHTGVADVVNIFIFCSDIKRNEGRKGKESVGGCRQNKSVRRYLSVCCGTLYVYTYTKVKLVAECKHNKGTNKSTSSDIYSP